MKYTNLIQNLNRVKVKLNEIQIDLIYKYYNDFNCLELIVDDNIYYLDVNLLEYLDWYNIRKVLEQLLIKYDYGFALVNVGNGIMGQLQNCSTLYYSQLSKQKFENVLKEMFK